MCLRRKRNFLRKYQAYSFAVPLIEQLNFLVLRLVIEDDYNFLNKILLIKKKDLLKKAIKDKFSDYDEEYFVPLKRFNVVETS